MLQQRADLVDAGAANLGIVAERQTQQRQPSIPSNSSPSVGLAVPFRTSFIREGVDMNRQGDKRGALEPCQQLLVRRDQAAADTFRAGQIETVIDRVSELESDVDGADCERFAAVQDAEIAPHRRADETRLRTI